MKIPVEVKEKAKQKLREHFRLLSDSEKDLVIDKATGLSLRGRLEKDIMLRNAGVRGGENQNTKTHTK